MIKKYIIAVLPISLLMTSQAETRPTSSEKQCLANIIQHESGHEKVSGKYAVGNVVLNRRDSKRFPNTVCAVMRQKGQFVGIPGYTTNNKEALRIAGDLLNGRRDNTHGAFYFHSGPKPSRWWNTLTHTVTIGRHKFYK